MKTILCSNLVVLKACSVFLGLVFLAAGTGKLLGQGEFIHALEDTFLTPWTANLIASFLPWIEIGVGMLLVLGLVPYVTSTLSIGLACVFIISNSWTLGSNWQTLRCADCFGVWETHLGSLPPAAALSLDVVLLCLAVFILTQSPAYHIQVSGEKALTNRRWSENIKGKLVLIFSRQTGLTS